MLSPTQKQDGAIYFDEVEIPPRSCSSVVARVSDKFSLFKGDRIVAWESEEHATSIPFFFIGAILQMPAPPTSIDEGPLTAFFSENAHSEGVYRTMARSHAEGLPPEGLMEQARMFVFNASDKPVKWRAELRGKAVVFE